LRRKNDMNMTSAIEAAVQQGKALIYRRDFGWTKLAVYKNATVRVRDWTRARGRKSVRLEDMADGYLSADGIPHFKLREA
jgi:hypothetical protein